MVDNETLTGEEELQLRKVAGNIPLISMSLCLVEFAERASYYGARTIFTNFIEKPLPIGMCAPGLSGGADTI